MKCIECGLESASASEKCPLCGGDKREVVAEGQPQRNQYANSSQTSFFVVIAVGLALMQAVRLFSRGDGVLGAVLLLVTVMVVGIPFVNDYRVVHKVSKSSVGLQMASGCAVIGVAWLAVIIAFLTACAHYLRGIAGHP